MRFDVAIIGAGIAGASLGWALAQRRPGLRLLLLEMEAQPGYHTTGRSAAFWIESYGGPAIVPLSKASLGFLQAPPPAFADRPLVVPRDGLFIAPPGDDAALPAMAAELAAGGVAYRWLDAAALAVSPVGAILRPEWRRAAIVQPCFDIDVAGLHNAYLRGARVAGDARVTGLARTGAGWRIDTDGGAFEATTVVNAAGAWADDVAVLAGARRRGLQPLRRTMAVIEVDPAPPADLPIVLDAGGSFYFRRDGARLWLSPHDEIPDVAHDVRPDELDLAVVIDRFEQATSVRVRRLESSWAGLRTFAPDRVPVFGWDGAVDGFFWCAGQGGFGIQTAPAAADLCAALLLGEAPALEPAPYLATRGGL